MLPVVSSASGCGNADPDRISDLQFEGAAVTESEATHTPSFSSLTDGVRHPTVPDVVAVRLPAAVLSDLKEANSPQLVLSVRFALDIQPGLDGLYLSRWIDDNGASHNMVASQFEATSARKAFPCVDQPDAKATFSVSVGCKSCSGFTALGNMPVLETARRTC